MEVKTRSTARVETQKRGSKRKSEPAEFVFKAPLPRATLVKVVPRELRDICRLGLEHGTVQYYPSRKQLIKIMIESCMYRAIETVFDAYSDYRHPEWKLSAETIDYVTRTRRGKACRGVYSEREEPRARCFSLLREIGCIPWLGKISVETRTHTHLTNRRRRRRGIPTIWGLGSRSQKSARSVLYSWFVGRLNRGETVRTACGEQGCVNPTHFYATKKRGPQPKSEISIVSTMDRIVSALRYRVLFRGLGSGEKVQGETRNIYKIVMSKEKVDLLDRLEAEAAQIEEEEEEEEEETRLPPPKQAKKLWVRKKRDAGCGDESDEEFNTEEWLERLKDYDDFNRGMGLSLPVLGEKMVSSGVSGWADSDCEELSF